MTSGTLRLLTSAATELRPRYDDLRHLVETGFPPRLSRLTIRRDDIRRGDVLSRE